MHKATGTEMVYRTWTISISRRRGMSIMRNSIKENKMSDQEKIVKDEVAFEHECRGYEFKATYLHEPKGNALIEITKDGETVREFQFPAYKIWNIAAHADDIVDGLEQESDSGLRVAGSDGLGGNAYSN
jgi:hypothetical protein